MRRKAVKTPLLLLLPVIGILVLTIIDPTSGIISFLTSPFKNHYYTGNFINRTSILLIASSGTFLASRAGMLNLGGEGQAAIGGIAAYSITLLFPEPHPVFSFFLIVFFSFSVGAINAFLAAILKKTAGIDILITSYLVSGGTLTLCESLISGPLRDPDSYLLTTKTFSNSYRLSSWLPPSFLNISLPVSLIILVFLFFFLNRTRTGFYLEIIGKQRDFARYAGIRTERLEMLTFSASGGLHGIAGALFLFGTLPGAVSGFSSGIGWSALTGSLLASGKSLFLLPSVFFINWIETGCESLILSGTLPLSFSQILTGSLFIFFSAKSFLQRRRRI